MLACKGIAKPLSQSTVAAGDQRSEGRASRSWRRAGPGGIDTGAMSFRAILAGLLAAVLFSLSSATSACQLRCGLASMGAPCHGEAASSARQGAKTMPAGMPGMAMTTLQDKHEPALNAASHPALNPALNLSGANAMAALHDGCSHSVCSEAPVLLTDEEIQVAQPVLIHQAAVLLAALLWSKPSNTFLQARGAPPLPTATPVSLHTTLRV